MTSQDLRRGWILPNHLETFGSPLLFRLCDLNRLGSCLGRVPNPLCFVVAIDIFKRPITQPHAVVMSIVRIRAGFRELFHRAK